MNNKINITLIDGSKRKFPLGVSGYEIAKEISESLAKQAVIVKVNNELRDVLYPIKEDATLEILKKDNKEVLDIIRHDCAHVMAEAVQSLYPGTQVTIGPSIKDGFYYDFSR